MQWLLSGTRVLLCFLTVHCSLAAADQLRNPDHMASFLVLSDIHLNHNASRPMEFSPAQSNWANELDTTSYELLIDKIRQDIQSGKINEPEFILLLGDLAGHQSTHSEDLVDDIRTVLTGIKDAFPNTPVLYNFGNRDSLKSNYGLFYNDDKSLPYHSPLDVIHSIWPNGLFLSSAKVCRYHSVYPCLISTHTTNGYYSAYLKPHLRLISLNSVMFSPQQQGYADYRVYDQLQWLKQQLREVVAAQQTAILVMHIPPGENIYKPYFWSETAFWSKDVARQFNQIIKEFHLNITGILAAHTHKDEIKVMDLGGIPIAGVYLNPALSTAHGNAPAVRSYTIKRNEDSLRWYLSDYQTYFFTQEGGGKIDTQLLYSFHDYYCQQAKTERMTDCLEKVSLDKIKAYLAAGNAKLEKDTHLLDNVHIATDDPNLSLLKLNSWFWF